MALVVTFHNRVLLKVAGGGGGGAQVVMEDYRGNQEAQAWSGTDWASVTKNGTIGVQHISRRTWHTSGYFRILVMEIQDMLH